MNDVMIDLEESPTTWPRVEIGSICEVSGGFAAPKGEEPFANGTIPFVRMQDLGRYHRTTNLVETKDKLNHDFVAKRRLRTVPRGSILLPRSGSVSLNHRAILGTDACIVSHICALTPKRSDVDNQYLYWALCNFDMRRIMRKTTGLDAITFEDVKLVRIPLPPLNVQRSVCAVLQKIETVLRKRDQANQLTNKVIQSVFLKMFGDPVTNPKGWDTRLLGEVSHKIVDGTHRTPRYVDHGIPFLTIKNIIKGEFDLRNVKHITQGEHQELIKRCRPEKGDILYSKDGTLGVAKVIDIDLEFSIFVTLALIKLDRSIVNSLFLEKALNSVSLRAKALEFAKGMALRHLHLEDIKKILVPVPPMDLQAKFVSTIEKLQMLGLRQRESTQEINQLFYSVMQKAFRGELVS